MWENFSKRIFTAILFILPVPNLAAFHLGLMHGVEIIQQDIAEAVPTLVDGRVRAPAADRAGQPAGHAPLPRDFGDGFEVGADGEHHATGAGEAAQALALGAKPVALGHGGFLRPAPARVLRDGEVVVLGAQAGAPRQVVVGLDEIVVAEDRVGRLNAAEEIVHPPPQFTLVLRHTAGQVDLRQGHAELVREAPESRQEDASREEVVLPVLALEHDGDVVLDQPPDDFHRIGRERQGQGEGFMREEIIDSGWRLAEEGWVALGEV